MMTISTVISARLATMITATETQTIINRREQKDGSGIKEV
jgi:hypothetical protein